MCSGVFQAHWVSIRHLSSLGLVPDRLGKGKGQGCFWNHMVQWPTLLTNPSLIGFYLSYTGLIWLQRIFPNFGFFFLGHNFILWKLHLHYRQGSWCWGKWNLCPKLTEFRREEWRDLNFKAGTLSTRLIWLYGQRNVFEQKNGTKWGSLGISTLV